VEAKWKANQDAIKKKALEEETKGNISRPMQVDVFGGVSYPVQPLDPEKHARTYKHLQKALAKRQRQYSIEATVDRAPSTEPGWSANWVKDKWKANRERLSCEKPSDELPPPPAVDLLGENYNHPPWIRLLQQPTWKVMLERKEAKAAKEAKAKAKAKAKTSPYAHVVKEPPQVTMSLEERPPGPPIPMLERNEASEQRYLATIIGRTAAKQLMQKRRQGSSGSKTTPRTAQTSKAICDDSVAFHVSVSSQQKDVFV